MPVTDNQRKTYCTESTRWHPTTTRTTTKTFNAEINIDYDFDEDEYDFISSSDNATSSDDE
jgi:hypothetical protein